MVMFNSYVSSPEGIISYISYIYLYFLQILQIHIYPYISYISYISYIYISHIFPIYIIYPYIYIYIGNIQDPLISPRLFKPRHRVIFRCGQAAPGASEVNQGSSPGAVEESCQHQRLKNPIIQLGRIMWNSHGKYEEYQSTWMVVYHTMLPITIYIQMVSQHLTCGWLLDPMFRIEKICIM